MPTVLIIDDHASVADALAILFSLHDIDTLKADSPQAGLALLAAHPIDLVIQDMNFSEDTTSGEEGKALFAAIRQREPDLPIILLTAWTDLETAVSLVKAGAADYLAKPWNDLKLLTTVQNLLELGAANRLLQRVTSATRKSQLQLQKNYDLRGFVFADRATEQVLALACQVARAQVPVLITGPNGAGKERIAEIIQANSSVRDGPFITINCGALPAELIEAELFGAEAGAYTGANKARPGKFEAADGGTLFLDEIGNLSANGQMKLLRVLETGRFSRLGSNSEKHVHVRVISATNANLQKMLDDGSFREDLYYRLNLIELRLPSLSERSDDILILARHFLGNDYPLDTSANRVLLSYGWPGNVRELKNRMEKIKLLKAPDTLRAIDLDLPMTTRQAISSEPDRSVISDILERHAGNIAQAAAELGLSRQALYRRMERLGIARKDGS